MWTASDLAGRFDEALQLLATPDADDDRVVSYRQKGWGIDRCDLGLAYRAA